MMRNMFAKYIGRGSRDLSTTNSSSSGIIKRVWDQQDIFPLFIAFCCGCYAHLHINHQKRKARYEHLMSIYEEYRKRKKDLDVKYRNFFDLLLEKET